VHSIIWSIGSRNRSGAILQPCRTPLPTANQSDITPSTLTQLHVSVYRPSMRSTTLLCRLRLHSSFHRAIQSTESNAAFRSTKTIQSGFWNSYLLWMIVFKVKIWSVIDRPRRPGVSETGSSLFKQLKQNGNFYHVILVHISASV